MEHRPGVYTYFPAQGAAAPVVFDVPRSGREYPQDFRSIAPFADLHALVSMYVEELWGGAPDAGCGLLYATFANNYIDANRALLDIDPALLDAPWPEPLAPSDKSSRLGIGLIHSKVRNGHALYDRALTVADVQGRIERYWKPYHARLTELIDAAHTAFGYALHLSCHCMTTIGPATAHDHGRRRSDICLGDREGTTSSREAVDALADAFRAHGYSVTLNDPFAGAESVRLHARPADGIDSIQIEMIKALYMDEASFARTEGFDRLQRDLTDIAAVMANYARQRGSRP